MLRDDSTLTLCVQSASWDLPGREEPGWAFPAQRALKASDCTDAVLPLHQKQVTAMLDLFSNYNFIQYERGVEYEI